jgi:formate dehydrogenase accessory protein FdhE
VNPQGGPSDFRDRLERARTIERSPATAEPLEFLVVVLDHQHGRSLQGTVRSAAARISSGALEARLTDQWPLLDLSAAMAPLMVEIEEAVGALAVAPSVPGPLIEAGRGLLAAGTDELRSLSGAWLDDPSLLDPRLGAWMRISAAPLLELAAAGIDPPSREEWAGPVCPMCGGPPQCSVIVEESGAFLQGSPRYLICARCAARWSFPRSVCVWCGEEDSRRLGPYSADGQDEVRVDACDSCRHYIKTFDLRREGARQVVPLVDDIATLALDVWAHEKGMARPALSLAGI